MAKSDPSHFENLSEYTSRPELEAAFITVNKSQYIPNRQELNDPVGKYDLRISEHRRSEEKSWTVLRHLNRLILFVLKPLLLLMLNFRLTNLQASRPGARAP